MQRVTTKFVKSGAGPLALLCMASVCLSQLGYRFNSTSSLPVGIWKVDAPTVAVRRGQIISVQPPNSGMFELARRREYIGWGPCVDGSASLLKPVAAIAGDAVVVGTHGIAVNGVVLPNSKPLRFDTVGRPLASVRSGTYRVEPGTVWLVSSYARSFDSRYFGAIRSADILGVAKPVYVGGSTK